MGKVILILCLAIFSYSKEIVLGVVPQQSPLKLSKKWLKVSAYLSKQIGEKVVFKTQNSITKFEKELYLGKYDIAYMNPYHFILANKKQGYEAFIRANKNLEGIILSREKNIDFSKHNFKNKRFLFPAPTAFAATLLIKLELKEKFDFDVDKEAKVLYVNSHDSVYKGISRDIGYLGGGIIRTYNNFLDKNEKKSLHIVYKTKPYPSHPIAYNPRVKKELVLKLQKAFLNMPKEIRDILSIKKFISTKTQEFDVIKKLAVDIKR